MVFEETQLIKSAFQSMQSKAAKEKVHETYLRGSDQQVECSVCNKTFMNYNAITVFLKG